MFYLGTGTKCKKEKCKEYKTRDGALKALAKLADGVVWDETGAVVAYEMNGTVTVAAGGPQDGAEASENAADGTETEKSTPEEENAENGPQDGAEDAEAGADEEETEKAAQDGKKAGKGQQDAQNGIIIPQGKMKVTVICDGSLNLRRSPSWDDGNICGRASRGQSYYVKQVRIVDEKKMVETIDGLFLSGAGNHVQFEQV